MTAEYVQTWDLLICLVGYYYANSTRKIFIFSITLRHQFFQVHILRYSVCWHRYFHCIVFRSKLFVEVHTLFVSIFVLPARKGLELQRSIRKNVFMSLSGTSRQLLHLPATIACPDVAPSPWNSISTALKPNKLIYRFPHMSIKYKLS